jgi:hypothetical protein
MVTTFKLSHFGYAEQNTIELVSSKLLSNLSSFQPPITGEFFYEIFVHLRLFSIENLKLYIPGINYYEVNMNEELARFDAKIKTFELLTV